jgi:hypothetical protein
MKVSSIASWVARGRIFVIAAEELSKASNALVEWSIGAVGVGHLE